jgi:hypothetical protein
MSCLLVTTPGLSAGHQRLINEIAHHPDVEFDDSADWVDLDSPMDLDVQISAEGGKQDILLEFTKS